MNEQLLSKRLQKVASYILKGSTLADIGSDHAYLPCYAFLQGIIREGIAGEVNEGPYLSAKKQVKKVGIEQYISVRKGNGLAVIEQGEAEVITIAGMGGGLIRDILEEGKEKLVRVKRLILQPNVAADKIRHWLRMNNWKLIKEEILEEDGKIYEILVAEPGNGEELYQQNERMALLLGPFLMKEKSEPFYKKWRHEIQKRHAILSQLQNAAASDETSERKNELIAEIQCIEEVLK